MLPWLKPLPATITFLTNRNPMDTKIIEGLRAAVMVAHLVDTPDRAELIAALRAEDFWNSRAPQMSEELLILRRLESPTRAGLVVERPRTARESSQLREVLDDLDAMRNQHAEAKA